MNPLVLAALPAFLGSLFLMQRGGASPSQQLQQAVVFCVAALACTLLSHKPLPFTDKSRDRALIVAAVLVVLPLLLPSTAPHRWLGAGGFRLYIASVVLPSAVLLLAQARSGWAHLLVIGAALAAQPDASQATAFALAGLVMLSRTPLSMLARAVYMPRFCSLRTASSLRCRCLALASGRSWGILEWRVLRGRPQNVGSKKG